jgi:hypothetical protein
MRFNSILRLWPRFRLLPPNRRVLLMEAAFWLAVARLAILLLPFPRIARHLGEFRSPSVAASESLDRKVIAEEIAWAIHHSALLFPVRLVCLPRALAGWRMLQRRGIHARLHFGASCDPSDNTLHTHAWLDACGAEVTGYPEAHNCIEIGYYAR